MSVMDCIIDLTGDDLPSQGSIFDLTDESQSVSQILANPVDDDIICIDDDLPDDEQVNGDRAPLMQPGDTFEEGEKMDIFEIYRTIVKAINQQSHALHMNGSQVVTPSRILHALQERPFSDVIRFLTHQHQALKRFSKNQGEPSMALDDMPPVIQSIVYEIASLHNLEVSVQESTLGSISQVRKRTRGSMHLLPKRSIQGILEDVPRLLIQREWVALENLQHEERERNMTDEQRAEIARLPAVSRKARSPSPRNVSRPSDYQSRRDSDSRPVTDRRNTRRSPTRGSRGRSDSFRRSNSSRGFRGSSQRPNLDSRDPRVQHRQNPSSHKRPVLSGQSLNKEPQDQRRPLGHISDPNIPNMTGVHPERISNFGHDPEPIQNTRTKLRTGPDPRYSFSSSSFSNTPNTIQRQCDSRNRGRGRGGIRGSWKDAVGRIVHGFRRGGASSRGNYHHSDRVSFDHDLRDG